MIFKNSHSLRHDETVNPFQIRFLEIGSKFSGITTCAAVCVRYFAQEFPFNLFVINLTLGLIILFNGFFIRRWKNTLIPSTVYLTCFMLIGINAGIMNGGFYAPAVAAITICPLFASLLGGRIFSSVALIATIGALMMLYFSGTQGYFLVKDPDMELGRMVVYISLSLGLFFMGYSLEKARHYTQIELQKKELQIRAILESTPIGMIVTNRNLEVVAKNQRASELLNDIGNSNSIEKLLPNSLITAINDKTVKLVEPNKYLSEVFDFENHGVKRRIRFKILDFSFDSDTEKNILINMIDESESVRAEEMQKALMTKSKMAALGEMASGIAHEINNPLAIIFGKCAVLIKNINNKSYDHDRIILEIDKIIGTSGRIAKIVSGLLSFAREGGTDDFTEVTVASLIENTLSICIDRFVLSGVKLSCNFNGHNDVKISCHPSQISQVLVNLLNNSFDELTASTKLIPNEKWVRIEINADEKHVELNIIDAGFGLSETVKEKIFNPFFTTKPVGSGTGLGLSISKGLIEKHGGTLSCGLDPIHKRNTCFAVKIPQKKSA